jgi:hypothetical protein
MLRSSRVFVSINACEAIRQVNSLTNILVSYGRLEWAKVYQCPDSEKRPIDTSHARMSEGTYLPFKSYESCTDIYCIPVVSISHQLLSSYPCLLVLIPDLVYLGKAMGGHY